ncbi:MAG: response regulator transcription factor [Pseudomonadota bacterium]|jgi:two-component system OmpR family response regulator|nr:DNA-binding response regulator [Pseudomonadota bacterium]QKK06408.1 MAG: response regulator transcription factor [Pseudomonadota bacterium]
MAKTILVVDDDPHIRDVVVFALEKAGMKTLSAANGTEALSCAAAQKPDLIVLDISMPEMDGLDVCRQIRKTSDMPVLFLSSRDEEIDKIIGLEIGGDDYVTKPFSPRELVARVNVILKRTMPSGQSAADDPPQFTRGAVSLNTQNYTATAKSSHIALTATEFQLLAALLKHPEKIFTRDELMDHAYGVNMIVSDRTIDSHIRRIRQKFAASGLADVIATSHGIGYKLGSCL